MQVNGKVRDRMTLALDASEETARAAAFALPKVAAAIDGKELRKIIYVPGRLLNLVV